MDVDFTSVSIPFERPLPFAWGELEERELLVLRLAGRDGVIGWGEAAPLEPYDGVSLAAVRAAAGAAELREACREVAALPQALAAVDLALWDLAGNRERRPVSALLSDN